MGIPSHSSLNEDGIYMTNKNVDIANEMKSIIDNYVFMIKNEVVTL